MRWLKAIYLLLVIARVQPAVALICSRYPANTLLPKSPVDENFLVTINGNPQTYILGEAYNVTIQAYNGLRFISFKLALETVDGNRDLTQDLGRFELIDPVETRYSPDCINMVESTNTNPKTRIDVTWVAPERPGSGCILIRTTLLQHRDVWYMDDGGLTRSICEENVDEVESAPMSEDRNKCCACDEARYELTFTGTWSRNHHPKDFPPQGWITRFSDIIGASHTEDYRFWEYGQMASQGMREFAEHGAEQTLEKEFSYKFKKGKIRTIIKARGPAFPNLKGQSMASIRADPQHHLLSLASKIDPSPDWIVGVSGLELCMSNCTWLEQKTVTLYPWDIGTDAGPSYTSPDQQQIPADVIRRMRPDFPNDPRSPFFGAPMKPLAILQIKRKRLYERLCEDEDSNNLDVTRECFTHPWTAWSECTSKCGEGRQFRTRVYKQPELANIYKCEVELRQDRDCMGEECGPNEKRLNRMRDRDGYGEYDFDEIEKDEESEGGISRADCQLTSWGTWSPCSRTCGEGRITRRRQYVNPQLEEECQNMQRVRLVDYQKCVRRECLEGARGGRKNQVSGEDEKETEAEGGEEDEEGSEGEGEDDEKDDEKGEESETNGEAEAEVEAENAEDNEAEKTAENEAEEEQETPARPGFSNRQQGRWRNRYGYKKPFNAAEQERAENEKNEEDADLDPDADEQEEDEVEDENDADEEEENVNNERNTFGNRYGYNSRYNFPGRRKSASNEHREDDEADANEDEDVDNQTPRRFGYNNRYSGGGRRRNDEIEEEDEKEEDDFGRSKALGRNRRPNTRWNPDDAAEPDNGLTEAPYYCFQPIRVYKCRQKIYLKNYWFYNHCEDMCMLFTADKCDKNQNKFTSLEACEETCRPPGNELLLRRKQKQNCFRANALRQEQRRRQSKVFKK